MIMLIMTLFDLFYYVHGYVIDLIFYVAAPTLVFLGNKDNNESESEGVWLLVGVADKENLWGRPLKLNVTHANLLGLRLCHYCCCL